MNFSAARDRLQGMRMEIEQRRERLHAHRESEPLSRDSSEQVVERENDDVVMQLDAATAAELVQIESAIARVAAGTYGRCASCGGLIEPARLLALPQSSECAACAHARTE